MKTISIHNARSVAPKYFLCTDLNVATPQLKRVIRDACILFQLLHEFVPAQVRANAKKARARGKIRTIRSHLGRGAKGGSFVGLQLLRGVSA